MNERSIFAAALDIADPAERAAYLDQACGQEPGLRGHIEGLLAEQDQLGSFLARPLAAPTVSVGFDPVTEGPGTTIGPYKLLQQIGEGGMGVVYMAEQETPVRRKVALKIIKPGMDSAQVVARFEAERQALAMMDHTNIARVFDAGTTDSRPALLRHGAGPRRADHRRTATATSSLPASGSSCSSPSARRSSTPTRKGSSTATSSRRTSW